MRADSRAPPAGRRPRRGRLRRRADGLRGLAAARPRRADRGGRSSRAREPAGRAVREAASFSRMPSTGESARSTASWGGPCRAVEPVTRRKGAAGSSCRRMGRSCSSSAAPRARWRSTRRRSRRSALFERCPVQPSSTSVVRGTRPSCVPRVARPDYRLLPWTDDFAGALAACDLVFSRAGGSIWEVAAAGKPAVLVPSPNVTADHQTQERALLRAGRRCGSRAGGRDRPRAGGRSALCSTTSLAATAMGRAMLALARPDAADVDRGGVDLACARWPVGRSSSSASAARA